MAKQTPEEEQVDERRKRDTISFMGLEFDKKINLPGAVALLIVLYGLYTGFTSITSNFNVLQRQHTLMWKHFIMHEKDVTQEELEALFSK